MDRNILITAAASNTSYETIRFLNELNGDIKIRAGLRSPDKYENKFSKFQDVQTVEFDFERAETFDNALENCDIVFLLRPPNLADVKKYFEPLIMKMKEKDVNKIIFLSVQGAETQKNIPHHKIENLILENNLDYIFLRPSYFMQNLNTTLLNEIKNESKIFMPSGKLKFNWIDVEDIGLSAANVINEFDKYKNQAYELTGEEFMSFGEVADLMSKILDKKIEFESPNILKFFIKKQKQSEPLMKILMMLMLHFLPRFSSNPDKKTNTVSEICNKKPNSISEYIKRNKDVFL